MATERGFINGDAALKHFSSMCRYDLSTFKNKSALKIWPGMMLAVYRHSETQVNPTLLAKLKVLEIGFDGNGANASIINMTTGQTATINHVPSPLMGFDILACFPHRPMFERTVFLRGNGDPAAYGVCASVLLYHRNAVSWSVSGQDCLESWLTVDKQFTDEGAFVAECDRLSRLTRIS